MFGNFDQTFGIPQFPLEGMDPQGGLFGVNATPQPGADPGVPTAGPGLNLNPQPAAPPAPPTGVAPGGPPPAAAPASPLGGGPLAPGGASGAPPPDATAPAAGVVSPFGRPAV